MKRAYIPLIAGLACWYVFVLSLIMRPEVSPEYAAYYMSRTSELSVAESRRIRPMEVGVMHGVEHPSIVFNGWGSPRDGRRPPAWAETRIYLELAKDQKVGASQVVLTTRPCNPQCLPVKVYANETLLFFGVPPDLPVWQLRVPGTSLQRGLNKLTFKVCGPEVGIPCQFDQSLQLSGVTLVQ